MSWLPGPLLAMLGDLELADIRVDTRVVIFPQDGIADLKAAGRLFGTVGYFLFTARRA
jgi:hypothetical protein